MTLKRLFGIYVCFTFSGCWFSHRQIPLPQDEAEFAKPEQKPLKFSDPVKFNWTVVNADSIKPGKISPFNIDKFPSEPYNPENFKPLPHLTETRPFYYSSFPDTVFDIDAIRSESLFWKSSLLGIPRIIRAGAPKVRAESYFTSFQFNDEQGLPGTTVQATLLSREGLLWIKTDVALCIMNNESIEIFPYDYGLVFSLTEDSLGQVWVRSRENGIFVIDRKAGIQKQFAFSPGVDIIHDKKGFIWLGSWTEGLVRISRDQKTFKRITTKNGLSSDAVIRLYEDRYHRIWAGSRNTGIDILDLETKSLKKMGDPKIIDGTFVSSFSEDHLGNVYVAYAGKGIDIMNIEDQWIKHIDSAQGIPRSFVFDMVEDNRGQMWIASTSNGVNILSKNGDSISHIKDALPDSSVQGLSKDVKGRILVKGTTGGLNIFPDPKLVAHRISKKEGLLDNAVWGLLEDNKQRIWIGTHEGVNIIAPGNKILKFLPNVPGKNRIDDIIQTGPDEILMGGSKSGLWLINESKKIMENIGTKEGLPSTQIYNLFQDKKGLIWAGTLDGLLIQFDMGKRKIRYFRVPEKPGNNRVSCIAEDSSGKIWFGSQSGMYILDESQNIISHYSTKEGLSNEVCQMILKDSKNRLWIATEKGMNLLDLNHKINTIFSETNGLSASGIYSVMEKNGRILAGTAKGLTIFKELNPSTSTGATWNLQNYGRQQGFGYLNFNENTQMITRSGEYWWGIEDGITMINGSLLKADSSTVSPAVTELDLFGKSKYFVDPGLIHGIDTLWQENKDSFYLKESFHSLNTDKQRGIEWDSLSNTYFPVNLSLPYNRNYIRFHFSNLLTQDADQYKYRYILDGVDEKWSPVTSTPISENYNNISPGNYTFRISASRNLGPWSEPSVYHFRIRPPWWYSWWAELIYVFIFLALLRFWVRYRSRQLQKENMMLEQKIAERTTALSTSLENLRQAQGQLIQAEKMASLGELTAGIAHEIQNPLNFVNNFSEVNTELIEDVNKALERDDAPEAKEILKDLEMNMGKITFHGKRADAIVKGMLLHSRASSGQKIPTDVNALADEYLRLSYHGLRAKDKSFNAQFTMNLDEKLEELMLVQQDIGRVFLNLFNNAFYSVAEKKKLAPEGYEPTVSLSTKRKPDSVEIRIMDNGVGIPKKLLDKIYQPFFTTKPAGQGTGLGLSLSYDIVTKEHGGKIDVVTKENEFTEFIIELPFQA